MAKETTAKPKRQRVLLDDSLWPIFIAACGGACVKCGNTDTDKLQRSHIQRDADGGPATLENLQPLCPKCNGEHNQHFAMRDYRSDRAPDWRDKFIKLVAQHLGLAIILQEGVYTPEEGNTPLRHQNSVANKRVIAWGDVTFEVGLSLPTPLTSHPSRSLVETQDIVSAAIRLGAQHRNPPARPFANARSSLERLAANPNLSREDFLGAAARYLDDDSNLDENANRPKLAWQQFADNFDDYLASWRVKRARDIKLAAEAREAAKKRAIEEREAKAKSRWVSLQNIRGLSWPSMTDDDRAFIGGITGEPLTVSDEDMARITDIAGRYRAYYHKTPKYQLQQGIRSTQQRLLDRDLPMMTPEAALEFKRLTDSLADIDDNDRVALSELSKKLSACLRRTRA